MVRLTFVGDIALDKPLLRAARERGNGTFDFSDVFHTQDVFEGSDLVIGNLETCFGGGRLFNFKPYHYNSPDSFCDAVRAAGIGLVGTANNHSMDEGVRGLRRTLRRLDACGIAHTGTFDADTEDRFLVREIGGLRIAFYSMTYSVNAGMESISCGDLYRHLNLTGFTGKKAPKPVLFWKYFVQRKISQIRKKRRGQSTISAHTDYFRTEWINSRWMEDIERQLRRARERSDVLVVLLHSGGQFNVEPGDYSKAMTDRLLDLGADLVIGNHPHTVQRIEQRGEKLIAYSLGGYCMSVSGEYLVHDCLPEYSLALHADLSDDGKLAGWSFDVLKGTEDAGCYLNVRRAPDGDAGAAAITGRAGRAAGGNART